MKTHPSHKTAVSIDASSYDEICERCGATDGVGGTLDKPCGGIMTHDHGLHQEHLCGGTPDDVPTKGELLLKAIDDLCWLCSEAGQWEDEWHRDDGMAANNKQAEVKQQVADLLASNKAMLDALLAYEQWEASLILDDASWRNGLPMLTQAQYDRLIELQGMRNAAKRKAGM